MTIVKRKAIKNSLSNSFDYITQGKKTNNGIYISSMNCGISTALDEMEMTRRKFHQTNDNKRVGYHIIQSFSLCDTLSHSRCNELGQELCKRGYPGFEAVIATHTDRLHMHNHILINAVNADTGERVNDRLADEKYSLYRLKEIANDIAKENGLQTQDHVIINNYGHRKNRFSIISLIIQMIYYALGVADDFDEFVEELDEQVEEVGYYVKETVPEVVLQKEDSHYTIHLDKLNNGEFTRSSLITSIPSYTCSSSPSYSSASTSLHLLNLINRYESYLYLLPHFKKIKDYHPDIYDEVLERLYKDKYTSFKALVSEIDKVSGGKVKAGEIEEIRTLKEEVVEEMKVVKEKDSLAI